MTSDKQPTLIDRFHRTHARVTDYFRGINWNDLYETESDCPNCGSQMFAVKGQFPESPSKLRCKQCGTRGYGGRVNND